MRLRSLSYARGQSFFTLPPVGNMFGKARLTHSCRTVLEGWNIPAGLFRIGLLLHVVIFAAGSTAKAENIPLPRERPEIVSGERSPAENDVTPSLCQMRLADLAVFKPLEPITGPGECTATDVVAIEALFLPDKRRVVFSPPATLRCPMAEAVAQWITKDVAPTIASLGTSLRSIEILGSFDCRPRNGIAGAQISEHGHANALDVRSFTLINGSVVELNSDSASKSLRERIRDSACGRFSTVLGNGADAYHDTHVHIDLMERSNHYKICQWDVLDPAQTAALAAKKAAALSASIPATMVKSNIPIPRPRPIARADAGNGLEQGGPHILQEGRMRTPVAVSLAMPLGASTMAYAEEQTITIGPWTIATSYKGDKFDSCLMDRSAAELSITFVRAQDGLMLLLESGKWQLESGKAYPVRLVAGARSVEAKALAESKAVTIALTDRALNERLRTADVLEVRGDGANLRVPLDGSTAALGRLEACFQKNGQGGVETNPFVAPDRRP
jgi:hypothetical protein